MTTNEGRVDMRLDTEQQKRVEQLSKKKAIKRNAVINQAIKEMYDREFPKGK